MDGTLMADTTDAKPKRPRVPKGYDSESAFLQEARDRFQDAVDYDRENRDQGVEDLKMFAGDQWDSGAQQARANRPMLTENVLPQYVAQVVGDMRINRPAIRVRPAEDADKDLADIREGLIRAIERDNDAQGVYADLGTNQVACGIGNFRVRLKYATDDGFDRDIGVEHIPEPFSVVWDPLSVERTGRDAEYCFVVDELPRKVFEKRFKDEMPSDLEIPIADDKGWYTSEIVRICEYWIMKETPVTLALLEGGRVVELDQVPPEVQPINTRKSFKRTACMYLISGTAILDGPYEMPIDRVPIIRARGWEVVIGSRRVRWGLVRFARDQQRLRNYWRSIQAEALAQAPKSKWLVHESQEGDADEFRDSVNNDDNVLVWSGQQKPEFVSAPPVNAAIMQEIAQLTQSMKDTTGIHDASLGIKSNETSGKAILARQREGDVATYLYHDNLQAAIKEGGRLINQLIPIVYDTARTVRVVGEDEMTKVVQINDPSNPDNVDINRGKYDIVVEAGPSYSTKRVEAADSMAQFFQAVPQAAQAAADLFAKAQDWPMADAIAERLKKMLPPEMTADPDEEVSPEEQQRRQQMAAQQQAQAQEQAQMKALALRKANAETKESEAKANKANAEAIKALQEAHQSPPAQVIEALFGQGAFEAYSQAMQGYQDARAQPQQPAGPQGPQGAPEPPQGPPQGPQPVMQPGQAA